MSYYPNSTPRQSYTHHPSLITHHHVNVSFLLATGQYTLGQTLVQSHLRTLILRLRFTLSSVLGPIEPALQRRRVCELATQLASSQSIKPTHLATHLEIHREIHSV
ncbi:hypothetical protein M758_7G098300 [Ceratodon purpureus]|nr:hypothetical protein M758_7G098300 [Ceratodon purpureus]